MSAVRLWLLIVAALICLTLVIGGATRLTGSGLSIVEWQPVTGVWPPTTESAWQAEFDKYKTIPQYREHNAGMTLGQFKTVYWWEWTHRMLARVVGVVFLLPFLWFLSRGSIERRLRARLWSIFGLGAALGAIGWWMVSSGLADRISVSQYRLAFHLTLACIVFAAVLSTAERLAGRRQQTVPLRVRASAVALLCLVLVQIYLGALVAGLHAGRIYNTWPLIDGALVPETSRLLFLSPAWRNFFENPLTVQLDHRMLAYALLLLALLHAVDVITRRGAAVAGAVLLAGAVCLQSMLGVLTLLYEAALPFALAHQAMALLVLAIAVVHAQRLEWRRELELVSISPSSVMRRREQPT
jgi:heme a synthase